jgi:hypothetical protein
MAVTQEAPVELSDFEVATRLRKAKQEFEASQKAKENLAGRNEFMRGMVRATDQLQATYQGGVGMVNSLIGNEAEAARRFSNYQDEMRQSTENPATVDKFFSADPKSGAMASAGNMATWAAGTAGSLIPSVAESIASGVAGGVAGGMLVPGPDPTDVATVPVGALAGMFGKGVVKKAIAEAAEQYVKQGVKREAAEQMATQAVRNVVAKRAGASTAASQTTAWNEGGGMYMEGREKGYDNPASAMALGQISGASEVAFGVFPASLRMVFKKAGVDEVAKKSGIRAAAGFAWDVAQEAGQEAFQEFLGSVNESINDPKAKLFTKENFVKWAESAAAGALGGGMFGAGGAAVSAYQDRGQKPSLPPDEIRDSLSQNTSPQLPPTQSEKAPTYNDATDNATDPTIAQPSLARAEKLKEVISKGYVSEEDGISFGIAGTSRKERLADAKAQIEELEAKYTPLGDAPNESEADAIAAQQLARRQAAKAGVQPPITTEAPTVTPTEQQTPPAVQGEVDWKAIATAGTELLPAKAKEKGLSDDELAKTKSEIEGLVEKATQGDVGAQEGLIAIAKELEAEKSVTPLPEISDTASQNEKVPPVEPQPGVTSSDKPASQLPFLTPEWRANREKRIADVKRSSGARVLDENVRKQVDEEIALMETYPPGTELEVNDLPASKLKVLPDGRMQSTEATSTRVIGDNAGAFLRGYKPEQIKVVSTPKVEALLADSAEGNAPSDKSNRKVYQGRGATPQQVYGEEAVKQGRAVPLLGTAQYYAFNQQDASAYGNVTELDEPKVNKTLVLRNDAQWKDLLSNAKTPHLNNMSREFKTEPAEIAGATERMQSYLKSQGYDSVRVELPEGEQNKRLRETFGHEQLVVFSDEIRQKRPMGVPMPTTFEELEALPKYSIYQKKVGSEGKIRYQVRGDGKRGGGDSLHDTIEQAQEEAALVKQRDADRKASEEKQKADEETAAKKQVEYEASFGGFLSDKPMNKGRQLKILGANRSYKGKVVTIKELIEQKVADGAVVNDRGQLESPDGAYLGSDKITKIGIDYAKHLIEAKNRDTVSQNPKPEPKKGGDSNAKVETEGQTKAQTETEAKADADGNGLLGSKGDQAAGETPSPASSVGKGLTEGFKSLPPHSQAAFEKEWNKDGASIKEILFPTNKNYRAEFEARTGVKLPKTAGGTFEAVEKWHNEGRKTVDSEEKSKGKLGLPSLKEGHSRFVHIGRPGIEQSMKDGGLDYSKQGVIQSTARNWNNEVDVEYTSDDPRFANGTAYVFDVPDAEVNLHYSMRNAPGVLPGKYYVGSVPAKEKSKGKKPVSKMSEWEQGVADLLATVPAFKGSSFEMSESDKTVKVTRTDGRKTTINFNADEKLDATAKNRKLDWVHGAYILKSGKKNDGHIYLHSKADHVTVLNHEVVHWLEDEGIITPAEVEQYGGREGIADAYAEWAATKARPANTLFEKIYDFLESLFDVNAKFFKELTDRVDASKSKKPPSTQPTYKELRLGFSDYSTTNILSSGADSPALWQKVKQAEGESVFTYYVVDTSGESVILSTPDYDQAKATWDKETELFKVNKAREQDRRAEESDKIRKAKKKAINDDLENRKSQDAQIVSAQDLDKPLTGKPIVVTGFHGSKDAFEEFDPTRRGETDPGFLGPAYYFYADETLAKKHGENVIRRDLRINKPLDYAQMMAAKIGSPLREVNERYDEVYDREMDIALAQERKGIGEQPAYWRARAAALATVAREFGYDGVVMRGGKIDDFPNTEIAVFDPPQQTNAQDELASLKAQQDKMYSEIERLQNAGKDREANSLIRDAEKLTPRIKELEAPRIKAKQDADATVEEERRKRFNEKEDARKAALPTKQTRNGWELATDGARWYLRDPNTKEIIYEGKLNRVREVADESPPDVPVDAVEAEARAELDAKLRERLKTLDYDNLRKLNKDAVIQVGDEVISDIGGLALDELNRRMDEAAAKPHVVAFRAVMGDDYANRHGADFDRYFNEFDSLDEDTKNREYRSNERRGKSFQSELGAKVTYAGTRIGLLGDGMQRIMDAMKQGSKAEEQSKSFNSGNTVLAFGKYEAKVVVPDLGDLSWKKGNVRIEMTSGANKGKMMEVEPSDIRLIAEEDTIAGKAAKEASDKAAARRAEDEKRYNDMRDELLPLVRALKKSGVKLNPETKKAKKELIDRVMMRTENRNEKMIQDAIDIVSAEVSEESPSTDPLSNAKAKLKENTENRDVIDQQYDPLFKEEISLKEMLRDVTDRKQKTYGDETEWKKLNRRQNDINKKLETLRKKMQPLTKESERLARVGEELVSEIRKLESESQAAEPVASENKQVAPLPGEQIGLPGMEDVVAEANLRERKLREWRKNPVYEKLLVISEPKERDPFDVRFGDPAFADANMAVFNSIREDTENRVANSKKLRDWGDVAIEAREKVELPDYVDKDSYDEIVSEYISDILPTLTDAINEVKNESGTFKIGDAVIDNETGEAGVIEKFAYNQDDEPIAVLESKRGRSQDEVPVEDLRVRQFAMDESFQVDTREEWDAEIKRRLRERMGESDYDNADIKSAEGLEAIDRAIGAGEDLKRDWYDNDEFRYLEELAVEAMPEPTEAEAVTEVKTEKQQVEEVLDEPKSAPSSVDATGIIAQLERKGRYEEGGVQHKIVPGSDMVDGKGTWDIERTENGNREVVSRGFATLEDAQRATAERILNPPEDTKPITGVTHVVEYYDDKRNRISKRFSDLKKAHEYARKHNSSVNTQVPPVDGSKKVKTVVKYNKKTDSFDVSELTNRQANAIDDRLEKETSGYGGDDSPPNLLRKAVREQARETAPPARETTDVDERIREAYKGMQDTEQQRGQHQSEARRMVDRLTVEIGKKNGIPDGRGHGTLSAASKYKDGISHARNKAKNDPGVKEQNRLEEVAQAEHAQWKEKLVQARKEAGEVAKKRIIESGEMLEPGTIIISNRDGVRIAGRIEGWNSDKGEYDYMTGMFTPSSGTFQPTVLRRTDSISHAAATQNFSTLDDYQAFEAVQQQATDAVEAMRTERSRKAEVAKQKSADESMRKRVTIESPVKTTVARVLESQIYAEYDGQDVISNGKFLVLESEAPANLRKRDKDLKEKGKKDAKYGPPQARKVQAKNIVDLANKGSEKLNFVAYVAAASDAIVHQVILTDGSKTVAVDADYYNFFSNAGFEFHGNSDAMNKGLRALALKKDGRLVGVVQPLSGDAPSLKSIQKVLEDALADQTTEEKKLSGSIKKLPETLYQTDDVNPSTQIQAFDIAWAAEDAGIKAFDQLVAYSVKTVGERRTREIAGMLGLAAKTAGFKGVRPIGDVLGVPGVTKEQAAIVAKAAFGKLLSEDQIEAGIDIVNRLGLLDKIGFAPFGSQVPEKSLNQKAIQTDTPEFKKWFGDSKVLDSDGEPMRVYHGTTQQFSEFTKTGNTPSKIIGHFFSPSGEMSGEHALRRAQGGAGAAVYPVYLSVKKPFVESTMDHMSMNTWSPSKINKWKQGLKDDGHDGIYIEPSSMPGYENGVWVAFESAQIKSSVGNQGTFDPSNPNILMQNQTQGGNVKGWTSFISATRAIIGATKQADVSTFIHEIAHPMRRFLLNRDVPQSKRANITDDEISMLEKEVGVKDGMWEVENEERFAKMWERYWFEGKAPKNATPELESLFEKIAQWMQGIYKAVEKIIGKPLPQEVRDLFDKLVQRGEFRDTVSQNENRDTVSQNDDPKPTSIKNEVANELRADRGILPLADVATQTQDEWLDAADAMLRDDPMVGDRLVREINTKARNLSNVEVAVMQIHYRGMNNRLEKVSDKLFAAKDANDPAESAKALIDVDIVMNALAEIEEATKAAGREWGRAGVARQIELNKDFSLAAIMRKARVANGGNALSEKQLEDMNALARKVADLEGKLAKAVQEKLDLERRKNVEAQIEDSKGKVQPIPESIRKRVSDKLNAFKSKFASAFASSSKTDSLFATEDENMADDAKSVIQEYADTMGVSSLGELLSNLRKDLGSDIPVSVQAAFTAAWKDMKDNGDIPVPTVDKNNVRGLSRLAKQIERSLVESGITELDEVVQGVHESLQEIIPDITRRETMDAMSGYGQYSAPSENPDDKIIADINGRLLELAKLDDMESGIAPARTGVGRQEKSDEHRELIRKVNLAKREGNYRVTDPDTQLKTAVGSALTALTNRIHDLNKAIRQQTPIISGAKTDLAGQDDRVVAMRKERDELTAIYKTLFPKPGATMEQRVAATAKALDRVADSLEKQMETRNFETKKKAEPISTEELDAKRARIDALRAQREGIAEYKEWNDEQKSKAYKANLLKQIADYKDKSLHSYFGPKPKKEVRTMSSDEVALKMELQKVKDEFFRLAGLYRLENMSPKERVWDYVKETAHLSRALMTSLDFSAVFRQGGAVAFSHPRMAAETSKEMYRAMRSAASEFETAEKMRRDDMYQFAMTAKLSITAEDGKITKQEEAFMGRWAKRIGLVAGSARGYTTFMNGIRFSLFKHMVANLGKGGQVTADEAAVIAMYINAATGRSELGPMMKWAEQANMLFFAPRFVASRFQYLGMPLWLLGSKKVSGRVKKAIAMEYIRHSAGVGSFLALTVALGALLAGDDEEEKPTVSLDPRSSDFLKIKLGETRIDPMSGLSQVIVLMGRIATGQRTGADGTVVDLRGENVPYGGLGMAGTVGNFVRTKFAPVPGAAFDIATGENVVGQDVTPFSSIVNLFIPLSLREIKDTAESRGIPQGALIALMSLHGMGSSTYGPESNYRKGTPEIREKQFKKDIRKITFDSKDPKYKGLLSEEQMTQVAERREDLKQSLVFSAASNPIRKDFKNDETYGQAVKERDAALENLKKSGLTLDESRKLLIDHWELNYGGSKEMRKGVRVYKEALSDRLRRLRRVFKQ